MSSGAQQSQASKFDHKRKLISDVATRVLNERGLRHMTLAEVADRLGLATRSIGYYFRTKEQLAAACYRSAISALVEIIDKADQSPSLDGRIRNLIRLYFQFRLEVGTGARPETAFFGDIRSLGDDDVVLAYRDMFRRLRHLCRSDGHGAADRTREICGAHLLSQTLYAADFSLKDYHPSTIDRLGDGVSDVLLNGLAATPTVTGFQERLEDLQDPTQALDLRMSLLRAATILMSHYGFKASSVDEICAIAKLTKGAFYHHFGDKDDVMAICGAQSIETVQRALDAGDRLSDPGLLRICAILSHLLSGQLDGSRPLLRYSGASMSEPVTRIMDAGYRRNTSHFRMIISAGMMDGSIRLIDAQIAADLCMTLTHAANVLHTATSLAPGTPRPLDPMVATRSFLDLARFGFLGPGGGTRGPRV